MSPQWGDDEGRMRCLCTIALALCCAAVVAKEPTEPVAPVAAAIRSGDLLQGRVDAGARVYYLLSASGKDEVMREYGAGIAKLYREMKGKGAELIWLSKDPEASVLKWAKKVGLRCPVLPDGKRSAKLPFPYGGENIPPLLVVLDAQGRKLGEANYLAVLTMLSEWRRQLAEIEREEKRREAQWDDEAAEIDWEEPAPEAEED